MKAPRAIWVEWCSRCGEVLMAARARPKRAVDWSACGKCGADDAPILRGSRYVLPVRKPK